jgi:hypothetical protein
MQSPIYNGYFHKFSIVLSGIDIPREAAFLHNEPGIRAHIGVIPQRRALLGSEMSEAMPQPHRAFPGKGRV